jgi:hypothetical protein
MAIANLDIQNTEAPILTVPPNKSYVVTTMMVVNTSVPDPLDDTVGLTTLTVYIVNNGGVGSISNANMVINQLPVTAGETFVMDTEKIVLEAGDSIILKGATPANLSATVSYVEI